MSTLRTDLSEIKVSLFSFLQHPVERIKHLPTWEWRRIILAQVLITMASGALAGLVHRSVLSIIVGLIQTPVLTLITSFISSLFFYYTFQIFTDKIVDFKALFTAVFFANIPFFIFQVISGFFPPILLVGLAFSALLLIVGFCENFQLPKVFVMRLVGIIYVLFLVTYGLAWWSTVKSTERWHANQTEQAPEVKLGE